MKIFGKRIGRKSGGKEEIEGIDRIKRIKEEVLFVFQDLRKFKMDYK